jgi:hypothetical protein
MTDLTVNTAPDAEIPENEQATQQAAEISPELLQMLGQSESTEQAQKVETEQLAPLEKQPDLDPMRVAMTEKVIAQGAGFVFYQAQSLTGRSLGLSEKSAQALAKGVAPCLVKYGIGEPSELWAKWGVEIQAALAVGSVIFQVIASERAHKIEQAKADAITKANPMQHQAS